MDYAAHQGDIIWISLDPQIGHEQKGRRPALVVSNDSFHGASRKTAMLCPITNTDRDFPLHVRLNYKTKTTGVILCDQAKILDIQSRQAEFIERLPDDILFEVVDILIGIVEIEAPL